MHSVPSNDLLLNTRPRVSSFNGGMEVFAPCGTSNCPSISNSRGSSATNPRNIFLNDSKDLCMTDLKTCLTELLNVEDAGISTTGFNLSPEKNDTGVVVKNFERKNLDKGHTSGYSPSDKCLSKCATFPPLHGPKFSKNVFIGEKGKHEEGITAENSEGDVSTKSLIPCYSRSTSLPVPSKLVPAIKGSREKQQGTSSPKKLSVTWAPDVYDPIPTSVSHVPSDRNQRYRKKSGKYKPKSGGKSSRGSSNSKSKDRKQDRKSSGGSSNKLKQPFHMDSGVVILREPWVSADLHYNVGRPDPFCGSSFLKEPVTKLHFPVAEAT
ncbi:hypothetical protein OROGR_024171 [Orobanche gracilis]